jgi:hypothetical protein
MQRHGASGDGGRSKEAHRENVSPTVRDMPWQGTGRPLRLLFRRAIFHPARKNQPRFGSILKLPLPIADIALGLRQFVCCFFSARATARQQVQADTGTAQRL